MNRSTQASRLREQVRLLERRLGFLNENDMSCCGVTLAQCHALVEIGRAGAISLRELAELLGLDNSTASRTIQNLVTRGLVSREASAEDRRYVTITLTETGRELFLGVEARMEHRFGEICSTLPPEKREQVLEALGLLLGALEPKGCC